MQDDQQMIKNIASGEPFDPVQAIRALARNANANAPAKEAPAAVMDAGPSTPSASSGTGSGTGPTEAAAKKRAPKDTTAQE
jgi:hypothetical protein